MDSRAAKMVKVWDGGGREGRYYGEMSGWKGRSLTMELKRNESSTMDLNVVVGLLGTAVSHFRSCSGVWSAEARGGAMTSSFVIARMGVRRVSFLGLA